MGVRCDACVKARVDEAFDAASAPQAGQLALEVTAQ